MDKLPSSLGSKAFGSLADPALVLAYQAHQDALRFLSTTLEQAHGVAVLLGPAGSGKTTLAKEQRDWSGRNVPVALLDACSLTPQQLTAGMMQQYGLASDLAQEDEQLQVLSGYLAEQTQAGQSPVLILDNADRASTSTLTLLNWLAALDVRSSSVLRIVLTGKDRLAALIKRNVLRKLSQRNPVSFSLNPMTLQEAIHYLRTRYIAAGGKRAEQVFSIELSEHLRAVSCGWPGALNVQAFDWLERQRDREAQNDLARIVVSRDGKPVAEYALSEHRYLIGRSTFADIPVDDDYASKLHAMLLLYSNAVVLLDLNSTNGTTVNSVVRSKTILRDNDVISLGRYRLKVENVPLVSEEMEARIASADTVRMQHLGDYRRDRAKRNIRALKNL